MVSRVKGLLLRIWGLRFKEWGAGFGVQESKGQDLRYWLYVGFGVPSVVGVLSILSLFFVYTSFHASAVSS